MNLRCTIIDAIHNVAQLYDAEPIDTLDDDTVLLQSGLDSLGFAAVVATLEEELGFDPFVISDDPAYPRTLREFVDFYERVAEENK